MKLILEAIKSLFRKLEAAVEDMKPWCVQSNWEQNDPAAADYIQHRTHYYVPPVLTDPLLEEQTLPFADQTETWPYNFTTTYSSTIADFVYEAHGIDADTAAQMVKDGTMVAVVWDGVVYKCACHDGNGMEMLVIGNPYLYRSNKDDTGEPFCIFINVWYDSQGLYIIANDKKMSHTVGFGTKFTDDKLKKLDVMFLPDETVDAISTAQASVEAAQTTADMAVTNAATAQSSADNAQITADNAQITADNAQITADNAQITADRKMSANNPVGTGSFSMNRKDNTTVGEYSHAEGYYCEASGPYSHAEGCMTIASRKSQTVCGKFNIYEETDKYVINTTTGGSVQVGKLLYVYIFDEYTFDEETGLFTVSAYHNVFSSELSTVGTYFSLNSRNLTSGGVDIIYRYVSKTPEDSIYTITCETLKATPLENTIGTYAHIVGNGTADDARSNAHTLDWDGNAWYAGSIEGTELILPSSTADSTKKFKITVDDSGTLTATEVTE